MKACETIVHLRREEPRRMKSMVPPHVWSLVAQYDLTPAAGEQRAEKPAAPCSNTGPS
jgi:coenzyme F420 hydrogenase subunit beta